MNEVEELEMTTDQALISALSVKKVGELELQPFSLMRQTAFEDLCPIGCGSFLRAIMWVWVCTLDESGVEKIWDDLKEARRKAFEWGGARGYSLYNYKPLFDVYLRMNRELKASANVRLSDASTDGEKKTTGEQPDQ